jgi:hypothetical protein
MLLGPLPLDPKGQLRPKNHLTLLSLERVQYIEFEYIFSVVPHRLIFRVILSGRGWGGRGGGGLGVLRQFTDVADLGCTCTL